MIEEIKEKEIFCVRHGESTANASRIHIGEESNLSEIGNEQTKAVARRIAKIPELGAIISSPSPRSLETAHLINQLTGIPIEQSDLFSHRRRPSIMEGKSHFDPFAREIMSTIYAGYLVPGYRYSDEENLNDLRTRAKQALEFLVKLPAQKICVVTHGSFLWVLFCAIFAGYNFSGLDLQRAIEALGPDNGGVTRFIYLRSNNPISGLDSIRWRVKSWSDISHLE